MQAASLSVHRAGERVASSHPAASSMPSHPIHDSPRLIAQRQALQAAFGPSAFQLADDDEAGEAREPTTQEKIEEHLEDMQLILDEVAEDQLEDKARGADKHYLANRMERLRADVEDIFRQYSSRRVHGERWLQRLLRRIEHRDLLPLLESTVDEMRDLPWDPITRNSIELPTEGTLQEKLNDLFAQAAAEGAYGIPFGVFRDWVIDADETERADAAADKRLQARMQDYIRRGEYPMFRYYLGVHDAPEGGAGPHGDVDARARELDTQIQSVLGEYAFGAAARGMTIEGRVIVLGGENWHSAVRAYFPNQGGADRESINGFTQDGIIYLNADKGDPGTLIHEGVHQHAPDDFGESFGNKLNEGVTEYFARKVCARLAIARKSYAEEFAVASKFIAALGEETVARAYFQGQAGAITDALIARWSRRATLESAYEKLHELRGLPDLEWDEQQALLARLGIG